MSITNFLDRKLYPNHTKNWDDRLFRERILARLKPNSVVLDLGAGAGIVAEMDFRGQAARICGVDLDPRVIDNPMLDEGKVADGGSIPYPDASFDLVFSDNVVEHLDMPEQVFAEVRRVLKPGGLFLFKTPNRTHYMPLIARMTPHKFHQFINRKRGRQETDTFPTRYRANTLGDARNVARAAGFDVIGIERIEGRPEYMRITPPTYLAGFIYERLVNSTSLLAPFRILLVAELAKPAAND
ncbi:class I SAM-dependent methyltransferase [Sphingomonas koreensis]|uniref:class I SAM-dependent methyltransferase n=1 Tax=Sphingomonas koreensis TaxID=93064 RepID=UPI000833CDD7|nr:class I SAM-dependent methyltransferase [Sphingomonas koreensis]PJI89785.1 methyltransferase family protein [Sphingomonas koreensis]RSU61900.1 class I SAM-dependent methyltransferase [Sphingomonas koreensis]RSU70554.1 class I SAM-dependent methyltransferase [Sphingomonas koreensis]